MAKAQTANGAEEKGVHWMQIKLSNFEADTFNELAQVYGFRDKSMFCRVLFAHIAKHRPNLTVPPSPDGVGDDNRPVNLQIKIRDTVERDSIMALAKLYRFDVSNFVRVVINHISETRPPLVIGPDEPLERHLGGANPSVFIERLS